MALPQVPASTVAAAIAGWTPAAMSVGMRILPTAAEHPDADGMARLIHQVRKNEIGTSRARPRFRMPEMDCTRCWSHVVRRMTYEKPMTVQIVGTSELLTIAFVNAFMTSPGNPPIRHIKRPARNSTSLASYFLTISTNVKMTIRPPANNIVKTSVQIYLTFQFFAMYIFYIFSIYLSIIINNFIVHHECTRKGYIL